MEKKKVLYICIVQVIVFELWRWRKTGKMQEDLKYYFSYVCVSGGGEGGRGGRVLNPARRLQRTR